MRFGKDFFEKHQRLLLKIANCRWTRWILGLNRLPEQLKDRTIAKITPNSIHTKIVDWNNGDPKVKIKAAIFTRQRFGEALAYNLSPFVYFQPEQRWQLSPAGAFGVLFALALFRKGGFLPFLFATTDTLYAEAGDGCTQGYLSGAGGNGWATARGDANATAFYDASPIADNIWSRTIGMGGDGDGDWVIVRGHFPFDASSIPSAPAVVELNLYCVSESYGAQFADSDTHEVVEGTQASQSTLSAGDHDAWNSTSFASKAQSALTASSYATYTLNASGLAAFNYGGDTDYAVLYSDDLNDSDPAGGALAHGYAGWRIGVTFSGSEETGTSQDPYIDVTCISNLSTSVSDSQDVSEAVTSRLSSPVSVSDAQDISESITASNPLLGDISVSDTQEASEAVTPELESFISVSDSQDVSEAITAELPLLGDISVSDAQEISESIAAHLASFINVSDSQEISESVASEIVFSIAVSDSKGISEAVTSRLASFISVLDEQSAEENVVLILPLTGISVSDAQAISESVQAELQSFISVSDSLIATDSISGGEVVLSISVSDTGELAESVNVMSAYDVRVSDSQEISESISVVNFLNINVSDSATISESTNTDFVIVTYPLIRKRYMERSATGSEFKMKKSASPRF